jgi:hypothetical protein
LRHYPRVEAASRNDLLRPTLHPLIIGSHLRRISAET